jgi:Zn-dependent peptidase ImmA (M78 family)/transcriptional regulator with XRE-family HTH domain
VHGTQTELFELPISAERLRRAREMRGLTQADLARAVEIDQSHVACLESGTRQPSGPVLDAVARILELPSSYFRQPVRARLSGGGLRYRVKADVGKRAVTRIVGEAEHLVDIVLNLSDKVNLVQVRLRASAKSPIEAARELRQQMGVGPHTPLPHLIRRFEKLGGIVVVVEAVAGFDGFAEWSARNHSLPIIVISDGAPPDRLRMNIAHELAHLVLHREAIVPNKVAENQAFEFARELLTPSEGIKRGLQLAGTDLTALTELKRRWGVSIQALVRCGHDLSVFSDRQYRSLSTRINKLGWKYEEPNAAVHWQERPLAVRKMAEVAFGNPLPFGAMEARLHIPESQLRRFFSRYTSSDPSLLAPREVSNRVH